jgi:hypothetical protein
MKVLTTAGLTKLIQLCKSAFVSKTDVITTSEIDVYTKTEIDDMIGDIESTINAIRGV